MTTELPDPPLLLSLEEAADLLGMSADELLLSRGRGLAPGTLGFKDQPGGVLVWKREDLEAPEPSPISAEKEESMARMVQTIAEKQAEDSPDEVTPDTPLEAAENICDICGRQFKSPRGLSIHRRTHDEEG